jgi:thiol-disulfide isomerase/thioredoxin
MLKRLAVIVLPLALAATACSDDSTPTESDAAVADAPPDAPPGTPDATPYPPGPYGYGAMSTIIDEHFLGYAPTGAGDLVSDNDPRVFWFHEYYQGYDPSVKVIMVNIGAGWCPYCRQEAEELQALQDEYYAQGVRVITVIPEDNAGAPADRTFVQGWAQQYGNKFPTLVDPEMEVGKYADQSAFPANVFIYANNMQIFSLTTGGSSSPDMQSFKNLLDYMVAAAP